MTEFGYGYYVRLVGSAKKVVLQNPDSSFFKDDVIHEAARCHKAKLGLPENAALPYEEMQRIISVVEHQVAFHGPSAASIFYSLQASRKPENRKISEVRKLRSILESTPEDNFDSSKFMYCLRNLEQLLAKVEPIEHPELELARSFLRNLKIRGWDWASNAKKRLIRTRETFSDNASYRRMILSKFESNRRRH